MQIDQKQTQYKEMNGYKQKEGVDQWQLGFDVVRKNLPHILIPSRACLSQDYECIVGSNRQFAEVKKW